MAEILPEDLSTVQELRRAGVLRDVEGHRIGSSAVVMVGCADGDRIEDTLAHSLAVLRSNGARACPHFLTKHGGALVLAIPPRLRKKRFVHRSAARVLMMDIGVAQRVKNTNRVVLIAHLPCAIATVHGFSAVAVVEMLKCAKHRVEQRYPDAVVSCYLHVDRGEEQGMRTYFVHGPSWRAWRERHRTAVLESFVL